MKNAARVAVVLAAFAGILTFSPPNYAGTFTLNPVPGIRLRLVPKILKEKMNLQSPPLLFRKKRTAPDPYAQAWKAARALATSA